MRQPSLSTRVGPLLGLVGSAIVLMFFFSPWNSIESEWNSIALQGIVDPMVVMVLLAAFVVFGLSAVALLRPSSPVLSGLCLYAASVGLLAQLYLFFYSFMAGGGTLADLPQLFSLLVPFLLSGVWLLPLGFLLSGCAMALAAIRIEEQAGGTPHHDYPPAFPRTEQPANETQARERMGGRPSGQVEMDEQANVWSIGKRRILAMIVGVLLYSVLSNLYILWEGIGDGNIQTVFPGIVLVLFFGIVYGPWVGLVTGGLGTLLNNAISILAHAPYWMLTNYGALNSVPLNVSHPHTYWPLVVGNALVGLIAGLPLFGAAGQDRTVHSLLAAMMRSTFAIIVGLSLSVVYAGLSLSVVYYQIGQPVAMTLLDIQGSFTYEIIPTLLVVVLLLPLLLVLLPARTMWRREVNG